MAVFCGIASELLVVLGALFTRRAGWVLPLFSAETLAPAAAFAVVAVALPTVAAVAAAVARLVLGLLSVYSTLCNGSTFAKMTPL